MTRAALFSSVREHAPGGKIPPAAVPLIDQVADIFGMPRDSGRTTSPAGRKAIRGHEGCELEAYPDPATNGDPWTIGVGHTGPEVHKGMTITEAQADAYLAADLRKFEAGVNAAAPKSTQAQFDAMVSLAFNIGLGNFRSSTLLKKHNAGDYDGAAAQFAVWNRANGKVMAGLTKRRAAEAAMYRGQA
jgi:lysozyme